MSEGNKYQSNLYFSIGLVGNDRKWRNTWLKYINMDNRVLHSYRFDPIEKFH